MSNVTQKRRREAKQCVECGRQDENTLKGRCRCIECTKKARKYNNTYYHKLSDEKRNAINNDKREYNKLLKKLHLCIWCKTQDAYTLNGRALCAECASKNANNERIRRAERCANRAEYDKKRRDKWVAEHKCMRCGKKLQEYYRFKTCFICRNKNRVRQKEKRLRDNPDAVLRGTPGYCTSCWKRPVVEGKKLCAECYAKRLISIKKAQEAAWKTNDKHVWRQYSCKAVKQHTNPI